MKHLSNPIAQELNPKGKRFLDAYRLRLPRKRGQPNVTRVALVAFQKIPHIKAIPGYEMFMDDYLAGRLKKVHTIVVDSSGNTAHGVARLAAALGFRVKIVLSTDVPESKKGLLASLSTVEIIEVPGGVAKRAREEARKSGHYHLNQYAHPGNLRAHYLYTGPEIVRALGGKAPQIIAIAMGTGGTAGGVAKYFKRHFPKTIVIGVRPKKGHDVPGARDRDRMKESKVRWKRLISRRRIVEISRKESFIGMRELWGLMLPQPGPTSGLAWRGLEKFLRRLSAAQRKKLEGATVVFLCPDDGRFYPERVGGELRPQQGVRKIRKRR